jgi:hypothetical protein
MRIPALRLGIDHKRLLRAIARVTSSGTASSASWRMRRGALEATPEPGTESRRRRQVHVDRPADHRRHVEVGDREVVAEQIGTVRERTVEHPERPFQHLERLGKPLRVALSGRQPYRV